MAEDIGRSDCMKKGKQRDQLGLIQAHMINVVARAATKDLPFLGST